MVGKRVKKVGQWQAKNKNPPMEKSKNEKMRKFLIGLL